MMLELWEMQSTPSLPIGTTIQGSCGPGSNGCEEVTTYSSKLPN